MSVDERMFAVLWPYGREDIAALERSGCPRSVPWSLLAPHEARAQRTHSQTLERLAERGGLSPSEMAAVIEDREWRPMVHRDAVAVILKALGGQSHG